MAPDAPTALAAAWATALLTRLPPGLLEAGACRLFAAGGTRAAAGFLGGIAALDAAAATVLLGGGASLAGRPLPPMAAVVGGVCICALAIRRLWRARSADGGAAPLVRTPALAGVRAALESPGWWNWWLLVGSLALATGSSTSLAIGVGLVAGIVTWGAVVLLTIRAGRHFVASVGEQRWERITGALLLLGGALLFGRALF